MLPSTAFSVNRKGVGCWRTPRSRQMAASRMESPQKKTSEFTHYTGQKRGLVILAEFTDKKFKAANDREKYENIFNTTGYTTSEGFQGSVSDYFHDQSAEQFELTFDVVGPFTTSRGYSYYGKNDDKGEDMHPEEMIAEMCQAADSLVNFADYDWDGDGAADEVFVVYAGKGEADTSTENLIWPHMWSLREADKHLVLDGIRIEVYACSNELSSNGKIEGIGTFCHEFSHCLGFPDFYDITYSGAFGMGSFDLMSEGGYQGNGFTPCGYTAYEKMACGWQQPIVLADKDVSISNLKPMSQGGDTYIIYNDAHPDEYYLIENRQKSGWDAKYPARGLMITHVDFDEEVWMNNIPNSIISNREARELGLTTGNDHQRMKLIHADNDDDSEYWDADNGYYWKTTENADLYPYQRNDSLTATSKPAATLYHNNRQGIRLLQGAILDITQNADRTINFNYRSGKPQTADAINVVQTDLDAPASIYTLDGRLIKNKDTKQLKSGFYIRGGKKIVIR